VLTVPTGAGRSVAGENGQGVVRIGSKNFTEQFILGELMAQTIENRTGLSVERIFNLGGTVICHEALEKGEIDIYPEYSGTSLAVVFGMESEESWDDQDVYRHVKSLYEKQYGCTTIGPFGFNNTYRLTVSGTIAQKNGWKTVGDIRDAAPNLTAGFTSEFIERSDGMKGLLEAYGLKFREIRDMSPELMYAAVAKGDVDVICAFSTDGRIAAFDLKTLDDDLHYFPPYEAMPVVRMDLLRAYPDVENVLRELTSIIDDDVMRTLNYRVDVEKRSPRSVAESFLRENLH